MPTDSVVVVNGNVLGIERSWSPAELEINATSLKANPLSISTPKLELQGFSNFMLTTVIDNTGGGSTGTYKLTINLYDESDANILVSFDLYTAGNLKADNTVTFTWGVDGAKLYDTGGTATITGSSADDMVRFGARTKLTLTNTQVSDSTTVTATCYLRART